MKEMSGAKNTRGTRGADWDTESCTNLMTALFPLAKMATISYTIREKKLKAIGTDALTNATETNFSKWQTRCMKTQLALKSKTYQKTFPHG